LRRKCTGAKFATEVVDATVYSSVVGERSCLLWRCWREPCWSVRKWECWHK